MYKGKRTCKILKEIRAQIAAENDIAFVTSECKHQGDCAGTCPKCEAEVRYLERELEKRQKLGRTIAVAGLAVALTTSTVGCDELFDGIRPTGGKPLAPEEEQLGGEPLPQIPITERTEEFLAVQLSFTPADFIKQSDSAIYSALKTALAEAQCLEEDERYVFIVHWDEKLYYSTESNGTVTDTYSISYNADTKEWTETRELLHLTFSSAGVLLSARYESKTEEYYLTGDMLYIPEIYRPDDVQRFSEKKELLAAMSEFVQRNKTPEEEARKFIRARWNEYYAHSRDEIDYYVIEDGYHFDSDGYYTREELTQPRYLALTFAEDGTLTDAVVTEEP